MKAVGYKEALPIDAPEALLDVTLPEPAPEPHDLQEAVVRTKIDLQNEIDFSTS